MLLAIRFHDDQKAMGKILAYKYIFYDRNSVQLTIHIL